MQKARIPITNFQYGEISPSLVSRTDSAIYNSSAQSVKNFFIRTEGGVAKRGGFQALHDFVTISALNSYTNQSRKNYHGEQFTGLFPLLIETDRVLCEHNLFIQYN